jgi:cytochrome c oxidase cbb3-type subunit 3/ubiquinol-cytochrome c reductase cytochrome c subunit
LSLVLLLAACDALPGKPTDAERPLRPDQVLDFTQLYGANCAGCHGADGTLGAARPLNDPIYLSVAGAEQVRTVITNGVADSFMPAFGAAAGGGLTDQQIDVLVRGMVRRWSRADPLQGMAKPPYAAPPGEAARGASVYLSYCAGCHGADGHGGARGGSIVDDSYLALVSDQALRTAVICGRTDLGMPDWRGAPGQKPMSDQDIADVVGWLIAQRPAFAGQPYAQR